MAALKIDNIADILIVDGGSTDGSLELVSLQAKGVRSLLVKTGVGKLSAQLRCAYAFALDQGYAGIVSIDGNDKDDPEATGLNVQFVQDNHSRSIKGVLRGLHYQIQHPQGKLVRVTQGEVFDVVVDLRRRSPQFGKWEGVVLSAENRRQLWIPPGFAHGFFGHQRLGRGFIQDHRLLVPRV